MKVVPESPSSEGYRVWTVGHSNHPIERFLELLATHEVEAIADVRSQPYSKYSPQFDHDALSASLTAAGLAYLSFGAELGGRPRNPAYYDPAGHVLYDKVAESQAFQDGVARLEQALPARKVAMMCSEEDPSSCHRRLLIARVLRQRGVEVLHIRGDGRLETEEELIAAETDPQMSLFSELEAPEWKSIPSVSPKRRQSSSSAY